MSYNRQVRPSVCGLRKWQYLLNCGEYFDHLSRALVPTSTSQRACKYQFSMSRQKKKKKKKKKKKCGNMEIEIGHKRSIGYFDKILHTHKYWQYLGKGITKCHFSLVQTTPRQNSENMEIAISLSIHIGYFNKICTHIKYWQDLAKGIAKYLFSLTDAMPRSQFFSVVSENGHNSSTVRDWHRDWHREASAKSGFPNTIFHCPWLSRDQKWVVTSHVTLPT